MCHGHGASDVTLWWGYQGSETPWPVFLLNPSENGQIDENGCRLVNISLTPKVVIFCSRNETLFVHETVL